MPKQGLRCANATTAAQQRRSVLTSLLATHRVEVDVIDSQPTGFDNMQPRAVHQRRNQLARLTQQHNDLGCCIVRQHCRDMVRALRQHSVTDIAQRSIKHLAVKKLQSVKCLILHGNGHMSSEGHLGKKRVNFCWPHFKRVRHPAIAQEMAYPVAVGLLGANKLTELFSKAWLGWCGVQIAAALYV